MGSKYISTLCYADSILISDSEDNQQGLHSKFLKGTTLFSVHLDATFANLKL